MSIFGNFDLAKVAGTAFRNFFEQIHAKHPNVDKIGNLGHSLGEKVAGLLSKITPAEYQAIGMAAEKATKGKITAGEVEEVGAIVSELSAVVANEEPGLTQDVKKALGQ